MNATNPAPSTSATNPSPRLFRAVAEKDYDALIELYAKNATCFVHSYLAMKEQWDRKRAQRSNTCGNHGRARGDPSGHYVKAEEKLDEYDLQEQQPVFQYDPSLLARLSPLSQAKLEDDTSYFYLLRELKRYAPTSPPGKTGEAASTATQHDGHPNHAERDDRARSDDMDTTCSDDSDTNTDDAAKQRYAYLHPEQRRRDHRGDHAAQHQDRASSAAAAAAYRHAHTPDDLVCVSNDADRLLWEASMILSDSRPPQNFVVYDKEGSLQPNKHVSTNGTNANGNRSSTASAPTSATPAGSAPPIYDGSVANATPPAIHNNNNNNNYHHQQQQQYLFGTDIAASGSGTILHLACAMDEPLLLAFLLCMGANACAPHTAFRRLLIHEAACNGSFNCLTLLLELGERCAVEEYAKHQRQSLYYSHEQQSATASPMPSGQSVNSEACDRYSRDVSNQHLRASPPTSSLQQLQATAQQSLDKPLVLPTWNGNGDRCQSRSGRSSSSMPLPKTSISLTPRTSSFGQSIPTSDRFNLQFQQCGERLLSSPMVLDSEDDIMHINSNGNSQCIPRNEGGTDFLSILRAFRRCVHMMRCNQWTKLDAARYLMQSYFDRLMDSTKTTLARSCTFRHPAKAKPQQQGSQNLHADGGQERMMGSTSSSSTSGSSASSQSFLSMSYHSHGMYPRSMGLGYSLFRPCADGHGNTPLHWAAFKNEHSCVSLLLQYHADPNARAHPSGWTPLHDAAYSNSFDSIGLLLDAGAYVDARANSGATPLCFAAQEDAAEAAEILLQRGANLTARCANGPHRDGNATANNGRRRQQQQQQHPMGHPPHSRFSGYTPLHYCAHYNAHRAARFLLQHHRAQWAMETPDLSERLPIHIAVARGSSDVLRELLHAGARIDVRPQEEQRQDRGPSPIPPPRNITTALFVENRGTATTTATAGRANGSQGSQSNAAESTQRHRGTNAVASTPSTGGAGNAREVSPETPMRRAQAPNPERLTTPRRLRFPQQQQQQQQHSRQQPRRIAGDRTSTVRQPGPVADALSSSMALTISRTVSSSSASSASSTSSSMSSPGTPVSSPILRSMIPSQPITSSKPWNCLTQHAIDECRTLISQAEQSWSPARHLLFTPYDRRAVVELLRVGKRLELKGTGIFTELWPLVLSFCGRGWFDVAANGGVSTDAIMVARSSPKNINHAPLTLNASMGGDSTVIHQINSQDDYEMGDGSQYDDSGDDDSDINGNHEEDFLALPTLGR